MCSPPDANQYCAVTTRHAIPCLRRLLNSHQYTAVAGQRPCLHSGRIVGDSSLTGSWKSRRNAGGIPRSQGNPLGQTRYGARSSVLTCAIERQWPLWISTLVLARMVPRKLFFARALPVTLIAGHGAGMEWE